MSDQHHIFQHQIATFQDVERYRLEAQRLQSRETSRLARRLFGAPARLFRRLRDGGGRQVASRGAAKRPRTA